MEARKQRDTSVSSTSELFGFKDSHPSSSSGIFSSIFTPPSPKVLSRESLRNELNRKTTSEGWSYKTGIQDDINKGNDGKSQNTANKDLSSIFEDQIVQPCTLSSSIYYGGQDIFVQPKSAASAGLYSSQKNNEGIDDSELASRGNWWQGSLYY